MGICFVLENGDEWVQRERAARIRASQKQKAEKQKNRFFRFDQLKQLHLTGFGFRIRFGSFGLVTCFSLYWGSILILSEFKLII